MAKLEKNTPLAPMPRSERYLSQRAVKAAEVAFGPIKIRKIKIATESTK